jgi:RNA polymerase sigma factor (sigma-70 family)
MTAYTENIKAEIEKALKSLAKHDSDRRIAAEIRPILYANLDRKRVDYFIDGKIARVSEYVNKVAAQYKLLSPLLKKIQVERSRDEWQALFERMVKWAYNFLLRKNFPANGATQDIAEECATEAAITMLDAHFPYDTDFDPWVHVLVLNTCRKFLSKDAKYPLISQESIDDLSDRLVDHTDSDPRDRDKSEESWDDLLRAIAQLPEARRQVIELIFFKGLKPSDVARKMGRSVGAIYNLQFNTLVELRKILDQSRDKFNE